MAMATDWEANSIFNQRKRKKFVYIISGLEDRCAVYLKCNFRLWPNLILMCLI
jgi:hypothetical protein